MRRLARLTALAVVALAALPAPARAWTRGRATTFAVLPAGASGPEGIEVDRAGNAYVTTFGFTSSGPASGEGQLYVFAPSGQLVRQVSIRGSSPHLLGLAFHPQTHALLVIDFGNAQVLEVDPSTGDSRVFMPPPAPGAGLNDLTFDRAGNVYGSDSFLGAVWRTAAAGGPATAWVQDPLLQPNGVPPFGANGLRFNRGETAMFVANTADDTVVKVPVAGGMAGTPSVFVNSINGADGLIVDDDDDLWVAANQADEIVVVDPGGKAIAKLGDFGGVHDGSPRELLFPASLRFSRESLLVTNLALDIRLFGLPPSVDSDWCAQVSRYTVARIPARIPPVP